MTRLFPQLPRFLSLFLLGFLAGAGLLNLFSGYTVDKIILEKEKLQEELVQKEIQLKKLSDLTPQKIVVQDVDVRVLNDDKNLSLAVEKALTPLLEELIGLEVANLDPLLVQNIISHRRIIVENTSYRVYVRGVLIAEKIVMYVEVKPAPVN